MADREGSIYYQSIQDFDFDRACTFLAEKKISFFNKHNNGNILALNDVGDDYEISYEQVKQEALSGKTFNVNIWLNERRKLFWTFRSQDGYFVFDFYLGFLSQEDRDKASKNIQELVAESEIGIFRSPFPKSSDNSASDNNTGGTLDEVDTGTEPFDLGAATEIDPNTLPKGNDFLEDILNGQFEFPDVEEGGSYIFLASGAFSDGIDETTQGLIGLADIDEVLESASRPSKKGSDLNLPVGFKLYRKE